MDAHKRGASEPKSGMNRSVFGALPPTVDGHAQLLHLRRCSDEVNVLRVTNQGLW